MTEEKEDVFFEWERAIKKIPLNKNKQKPIIIISETNKKGQYQVDISDKIGKKQGYKIMKTLVEIFEKGEEK